ncbi:MAG: rhomboid family intramembrane serine protease [Longimicrobiales bacterium]
MFPIRDENPTELTPVVTVAFILANVAVWIYVQGAGMNEAQLVQSVCAFGVIPAEVTGQTGAAAGVQLGPGAVCAFGGLTRSAALTSMFLHGSWLHLLGNMWFLWLFGNNVEDSMGHGRYLVFYLLVGLAATAAHIWFNPDSPVPTVGASGAISGVMGAYLLLYPRVRVDTLFVLFVFVRIIPIPAWFVLLEWFVLQFLASAMEPATTGGGVAYGAHIGGFVAGAVLIPFFRNAILVRAKRRHVKLRPTDVPHRGWW